MVIAVLLVVLALIVGAFFFRNYPFTSAAPVQDTTNDGASINIDLPNMGTNEGQNTDSNNTTGGTTETQTP